MIKLLDGIEDVGEEVKCKECGSVVHCGEYDWQKVSYYYHNELHFNEAIDCPKCDCVIYRWKTK